MNEPDFTTRPAWNQPKALSALLAPSSPPDRQLVESGLQLLHEAGIKVIPPHAGAPADFSAQRSVAGHRQFPYLAGSDTKQAQQFKEIMGDPGIDLVWCLRGGYGSIRWMHLICWETLKKPGPIVVGFSDTTFIHAALNQIGRKSLHAPLIATLAATSAKAREALWHALKTGCFPTLSGRPLVTGKRSGRLIGGNLTCLAHLVGTPFEPQWDGAILFLEDQNEALYRLDRTLTHLRLSNRLSRVAGIATGPFLDTEAPDDLVRALLLDRLGDLGVPVVTDIPAGHGPENFPLLLGGGYDLDGTSGSLTPAARHR